LAHGQHDSEASFVSHHVFVSFNGLCQRYGFNHGAYFCLALKRKSVSSAFIEDPVIVPAIERMPKRSGTGFTSTGPCPPTPATKEAGRRTFGRKRRQKISSIAPGQLVGHASEKTAE
jgi:hypothetical protein